MPVRRSSRNLSGRQPPVEPSPRPAQSRRRPRRSSGTSSRSSRRSLVVDQLNSETSHAPTHSSTNNVNSRTPTRQPLTAHADDINNSDSSSVDLEELEELSRLHPLTRQRGRTNIHAAAAEDRASFEEVRFYGGAMRTNLNDRLNAESAAQNVTAGLFNTAASPRRLRDSTSNNRMNRQQQQYAVPSTSTASSTTTVTTTSSSTVSSSTSATSSSSVSSATTESFDGFSILGSSEAYDDGFERTQRMPLQSAADTSHRRNTRGNVGEIQSVAAPVAEQPVADSINNNLNIVTPRTDSNAAVASSMVMDVRSRRQRHLTRRFPSVATGIGGGGGAVPLQQEMLQEARISEPLGASTSTAQPVATSAFSAALNNSSGSAEQAFISRNSIFNSSLFRRAADGLNLTAPADLFAIDADSPHSSSSAAAAAALSSANQPRASMLLSAAHLHAAAAEVATQINDDDDDDDDDDNPIRWGANDYRRALTASSSSLAGQMSNADFLADLYREEEQHLQSNSSLNTTNSNTTTETGQQRSSRRRPPLQRNGGMPVRHDAGVDINVLLPQPLTRPYNLRRPNAVQPSAPSSTTTGRMAAAPVRSRTLAHFQSFLPPPAVPPPASSSVIRGNESSNGLDGSGAAAAGVQNDLSAWERRPSTSSLSSVDTITIRRNLFSQQQQQQLAARAGISVGGSLPHSFSTTSLDVLPSDNGTEAAFDTANGTATHGGTFESNDANDFSVLRSGRRRQPIETTSTRLTRSAAKRLKTEHSAANGAVPVLNGSVTSSAAEISTSKENDDSDELQQSSLSAGPSQRYEYDPAATMNDEEYHDLMSEVRAFAEKVRADDWRYKPAHLILGFEE